jgi:hypothetical protein
VVWPWQRGRGRGDRALSRVGQRASGPDRPDEAPVGSSGSSTRAPDATRVTGGMDVSGLRTIPSGGSFAERPAYDLSGMDPLGQPVEVCVLGQAGRTLLAFLAVDCYGCEPFWQGIGDPATLATSSVVSRVVVTKGPDQVPYAAARAKSSDLSGVPVVMSDSAWTDYRVLSYPSFLVVDGSSGMVVGETVGVDWDDVRSILRAIDS